MIEVRLIRESGKFDAFLALNENLSRQSEAKNPGFM